MDDKTRQMYADARQYERDTVAKFTEMCPDGVPTPEWEKWVRELDAWNAGLSLDDWNNRLAAEGVAGAKKVRRKK